MILNQTRLLNFPKQTNNPLRHDISGSLQFQLLTMPQDMMPFALDMSDGSQSGNASRYLGHALQVTDRTNSLFLTVNSSPNGITVM